MPDIFLSYSHLDREAARNVAARLEADGFNAWWDQTLVAGDTWAEVTRTELKSARAVVVLWSRASWASRWVQAEAYAGYERRCLVCARIDDVSVEPPFNILQTVDLRTPDGLDRLAAGVRHALGGAAIAAKEPREAPAPRKTAAIRIAVLPFDNLSPDPSNAFFADGIHEQVLSTLASRARGVEVISRTTMMSFRGRAASVAAIREELRCTHVLEGTVRREGDAVRLTVQLIDAFNDQHVWSEDFDRTLTNALTLQSEVASEVATQLCVKLTPKPARGPAETADPRAYDLYLKARIARQNLGGSADPLTAWRDIDELLGTAIARAPDFALAYVERAVGNWYLFISNFDTSQKTLALVRADLETLQKLAPGEPSVVAVEALWAIVEQDYAEALRLLTKAEELGLADPDLLQWKAVLLARLNRREEARRLFDSLISLDPGNLFLLMFVFTAEVFALRPIEAARIADLGLTRSPANIVWIAMKANLKALFCGDVAERSAIVEMIYANLVAMQFDPDGFIAFYVEHLIFERRFEEALAVIDSSKRESFIMIWYASLPVIGLGRFPLAGARGKVNLLLGRNEDAKADGDAVLAYAARQKTLKMNAWAFEALRAFGLMLKGEAPDAIAASREAVTMALDLPDAVHWAAARHIAAQVCAFSGAEDEAATLLEKISESAPGVAPLYALGDPAFADRLASNERYRALAARLRAGMASLKID